VFEVTSAGAMTGGEATPVETLRSYLEGIAEATTVISDDGLNITEEERIALSQWLDAANDEELNRLCRLQENAKGTVKLSSELKQLMLPCPSTPDGVPGLAAWAGDKTFRFHTNIMSSSTDSSLRRWSAERLKMGQFQAVKIGSKIWHVPTAKCSHGSESCSARGTLARPPGGRFGQASGWPGIFLSKAFGKSAWRMI
jgi:hypothetical protein